MYLVQMVSSVCGGDQVRSKKTSVSCLQSSMMVGVPWSGAAWALPSYSSLREPWMPTCTVTYWSRAWSPPFGDRAALFQHDNDPKHTSKMTTALLKKLRVKVICGASSNERWRSSRSLTSTSSLMSSWSFCALLFLAHNHRGTTFGAI